MTCLMERRTIQAQRDDSLNCTTVGIAAMGEVWRNSSKIGTDIVAVDVDNDYYYSVIFSERLYSF